MTYELDPFVSPGEIAIRIPGLPVFFEENYHDAELAAQAWAAVLLLWKPTAFDCGSFDRMVDAEFAPIGWSE